MERNCGIVGPKPISSDSFCLEERCGVNLTSAQNCLVNAEEDLKSLRGFVSPIAGVFTNEHLPSCY